MTDRTPLARHRRRPQVSASILMIFLVVFPLITFIGGLALGVLVGGTA